jgi:outer membrane protein assembly factor BamB
MPDYYLKHKWIINPENAKLLPGMLGYVDPTHTSAPTEVKEDAQKPHSQNVESTTTTSDNSTNFKSPELIDIATNAVITDGIQPIPESAHLGKQIIDNEVISTTTGPSVNLGISENYISSFPKYVDGRLFVSLFDGSTIVFNEGYKLDVTDIWSKRLPGIVPSRCASDGQFIFISSTPVHGDGKYYFHALNALDGSSKWGASIEGNIPIDSHPVVDDRYVYILSNSNKLYSINKYSGDLNWIHDESKKSLFGIPTIREKVIYFYSSEPKVYAVGVDDGKTIFSIPTVSSPIFQNVIVYKSHLIIFHKNFSVALVNIARQEPVNSLQIGFVDDIPIHSNDEIYFVTKDAFVNCLDLKNFTIKWRRSIGGSNLQMSLCNNQLYVTNSSRYLWILSAKNPDNIIQFDLRVPIIGRALPIDRGFFITWSFSGYNRAEHISFIPYWNAKSNS